ncbi:MAG: metal-dependent transcriptional regulator [Candidatus Thalassarchaeaceae archaeon]|nr:MAG: hypothetical protein CMA04_001165 [Euryarchaeota archaeon]RPG76448.1 MAG: metal-dependent transcriptional regulator [Euryarchaeota archaeon TMED85]|tara:strand:- start:2100 stop:2744 length:645 start_codon:yes stop_codon:yes gene_type:complete
MENLTEFEEMYIKRIYEVHDHSPDAIVRTSQLAELMNISSASVTEMIQRLSTRDLVTYIPYKGCRLTPTGFHYGASVKRRQLLLEILLSNVLGIKENISEIACRMEHAIDSTVESAIDRSLGFPQKTPDGKKIPVIGRDIDEQSQNPIVALSDLPLDSSFEVVLIICPPSELPALESAGVTPGVTMYNSENGPMISDVLIQWADSVRLLVRLVD